MSRPLYIVQHYRLTTKFLHQFRDQLFLVQSLDGPTKFFSVLWFTLPLLYCWLLTCSYHQSHKTKLRPLLVSLVMRHLVCFLPHSAYSQASWSIHAISPTSQQWRISLIYYWWLFHFHANVEFPKRIEKQLLRLTLKTRSRKKAPYQYGGHWGAFP